MATLEVLCDVDSKGLYKYNSKSFTYVYYAKLLPESPG